MQVVPLTFEAAAADAVSPTVVALFGSAAAYHDPLRLVLLAHQGLPASKAQLVRVFLQLDAAQLAAILGITLKTLRAYQQEDKLFDTAKSEQLLKLTQVGEVGQEVFGDVEALQRWLSKPAYGLANQVPLELLHTSGGIDLVLDELTRIAYGDLA